MTHELTRRSALRGALIAVVGGVAGFLVTRNTAAAKEKNGTTQANAYGPTTNDTTGNAAHALVAVSAVPAGGGKILTDPPVVVVRTQAGEVRAFSSICTHEGCAVSRVADGTIDCPCHGSRFDANTGRVVTGPATAPLPPVAVKVRNGEVFFG
jgi:Rieske Fe-S protein